MHPHAGKLVLNGAPSQLDRRLPALAPNYALVDGRSFAELLAFPSRFGALVDFYNLQDEKDGDWVGFFLSDPTMMLAVLETLDLSALDRDFTELYDRTRHAVVYAEKFAALSRLFAFVQGLARRINDALVALGARPASGIGRQFWDLLADAIVSSLGARLRQLKAYAEGAASPKALGQPIPLDWQGFLSIWDLADDCPDDSIYRGHSRNGKIDHALPHLVPIFAAFRESFADFQTFARANLEASLHQSDHKPQIGLYIAFARLFETAQATINTISARYVEFYYRDMLREAPAGPVGDHVYLTFTLADGTTGTTVPAGTAFPAGQDAEGKDIVYVSEKSLLVTPSRIETVRTLRALHRPLLDDDANSTAVLQRVMATEVALADAIKNTTPWATFGQSEAGTTPVSVTHAASLGFAVSTACLLLAEGERDIAVSVGYSDIFKSERLDPLLEEIAAVAGTTADAVLAAVLADAFTVVASTASGWLPLPPYTIELPDDGEASFVFKFALPSTAPAIAPYDAAAQGAAAGSETAGAEQSNPTPDLPTFKFYLRQAPVLIAPLGAAGTAVEVYPLSLLDGMPVETLTVAADVEGLTDPVLESTTGPVDMSAPFPLFGAPAVCGSYLDIRSPELFVKRIDALDISIGWFDLPPNTDGFKGYYRDYVIGLDGKEQPELFDNAVFRASIAVVNPGQWTIDSGNTDLFLFRTQPDCVETLPDAPLCPATCFDFPADTIQSNSPPAYYNPSDGAVRLTLTAPSYAFGDDLYAQNVLYAVLSDLPDDTTCQEACEAKYAALADSAKAVAAAIDGCSAAPDGEFRGCIQVSLAAAVEEMLGDVVQILSGSLKARQQRIEPTDYAELNVTLLQAASAERDQRAQKLEDWIDSRRAEAELDPDCVKICLFILDAVIKIAICLSGCASEPDDAYRGCVLPCLTACREGLTQAHAQLLAECIAACSEPKKTMNYPNAPWLPTAQTVSVDYSAWAAVLGGESVEGVFSHLTAFDGYERMSGPVTLLPVIANEGNLLLGFSGLTPGRTLTLLFQMASTPGSAAGGDSSTVEFEYLSQNRWCRLEPIAIAGDETNGLENSGILKLDLPVYQPGGNTVLPDDREWLRASLALGAALFPDSIGIYPNATLARWQDAPGGGNTLDKPLPTHSITSSVEPLPDVDTIDQPMESFGGRPPEDEREFQDRLGERLRHKDRAIAGWDYERLVLAQFPIVWKVQALPARTPQHGDAPGNVLIVVVPGADTPDIADPTVPVASGALLAGIRFSLEGRTSPFVRLHVVNPVYVRVRVQATVQFAQEEEAGSELKRLNDELVRYLSPWYYDLARAAKGGRYADPDEIEAFIESQPGVEAVRAFALSYDPPIDPLDWYFLTSAEQHDLVAADTNVDAWVYGRAEDYASGTMHDG
jgi:hypothetical protein